MSDNLILYEPVESENGLSCPYPGCNKCVDVSKRTQLEAHIRSHRKRKRRNKNIPTVKTENDDVKVEVIEIETADKNDSVDNNAGKLIEFEFSDDDTGNGARKRTEQKRMRKAAVENDPNQNKQPYRHTDFSKDEVNRYQVSENNVDECVVFAVKIEGESSEPSETETPTGKAGHTDNNSEMFIQSTDPANEIILPIDDEPVKSEPDIKVEEINTEREEDAQLKRQQDWFYVRDEDSIKRMFVCKLCYAEYEYLHQLHRHAFACPYKNEIGHTKIKNLVRNQFVLPRSKFLTKVKTKPPKLVRTKGSFYCDICQQVSLRLPIW